MSSVSPLDSCDVEIRRKHSASHVMTFAVKMLYPDVCLGVGPWTEEGFYQDFDFGEESPSDSVFKKIEKKMRWIVNKNFTIEKVIVSPEEAFEFCKDDPYKTELVQDILDRNEELSFYQFINEEGRVVYADVCAGPHLESTGELGVFQITKLSASYWRGDAKNKSLTRIYGIVFGTQEEMDAYQKKQEEALKRDHRKLGKELDLYTIDPEVGIGLPLWKPKGAFIISKLRNWFEAEQQKRGYMPVYTPHIGRKKLWEKSGHWGFYNDSMYPPVELGQTLEDYQDSRKVDENETYLLKPMNCPFHISIYNDGFHSYRDLPMRLYEFGTVYRYEQKGELGGLTRVRGFTQDDAHIICTKEQIEEEIESILSLGLFVLKETFGFDITLSASFRDPNSTKYLGSDEDWERAEGVIRKILKKHNIAYTEELGEAAFYGPKMDFKVQDAIGRKWQLSTIQFDFNLPERFDMTFINKEGKEERPLVVHRAMLGSIERFMGILIEHYAGAFPAWMSPVQAHILPVNSAHEEFSRLLAEKIRTAGGRVEIYDSSDSLGKRIRNCQKGKIPFAVVVGDTEVESFLNNGDESEFSGMLTVRKYGEQKDEKISFSEFVNLLAR